MLKNLIEEGFGNDLDLNCAEKILYGANKAYSLGLDDKALKLAAGFGGGMGIESVCGVLTGGIMVLSKLFVDEVAHQSNIKEITQKFFARFEKEMGSIGCTQLKADYRTEELKCHRVILKGAEILDELIMEEKTRQEHTK